MKFQKTPIAIAAFALFAGAPAVIPSTAHAAPTVSWSTPAAGATITQLINQTHACEVTGSNIKRVVFSITASGGTTTALNTELTAPWNCILDPKKFAPGAYTLRATAYDATSGGASATATRNVNLSGGTGGTTNTPPSVSVTAPGSTVSGASVSCGANATDSNGVAQVQFFLDSSTTAFATDTSAPYTCSFDSTKLSNGGHTLKVTATDSLGANTTVQRSFTVSNTTSGGGTTNTPPTVSITSPSGTVSGTNVSCGANASDSNGVAQVRFFLDNASTPFATEGGAPYTCSFDSTKLSNGSHTLKAIATDTLGASSTTQVSFSVSNGTGGGGTGSGLSFKTPLDGQTISGVFNQQSTCEVATSGISPYRVKFFLNTTALNTEGSAPWQCNLDTRKFTDGVYTLKAQALNSSGATTGTAQISVRIQNGTTNVAPSVSIMKPDAGATITEPLNSTGCYANASDSDGSIKQVDFVLSNGSTSKSVGSKTAAPYQCAINTADFANGTYTLMAQATDNAGAVSTTQRNLTINKQVSDPGGGGTSPIAAADILTRASADIPFAEQRGYTAQVINTYTSASAIPESGIQGSVLPDGDRLRFGKTADPLNSTLKALAFQVTSSDPTTSGGKRTELSVERNIEANKTYWIAFSVFVHDWGTLSTSDLALFGAQLHQGNDQLKVGGPAFGLYTKQNGRHFRVRGRYSESSTPSASNAFNVEFTDYPIPFGRWADFVLKFKENTSGNGLLQVWMDGVQIADYHGSLGYNTGVKDYVKFGYYNWSLSTMSSAPRKVLMRSPTIVADPTGQTYTHEQLRAHVGTGAASTASTGTSTTGTGTSTTGTGTTTTASSGGGGVCSTIECAAQ